jgi:hypothetical protein
LASKNSKNAPQPPGGSGAFRGTSFVLSVKMRVASRLGDPLRRLSFGKRGWRSCWLQVDN